MLCFCFKNLDLFDQQTTQWGFSPSTLLFIFISCGLKLRVKSLHPKQYVVRSLFPIFIGFITGFVFFFVIFMFYIINCYCYFSKIISNLVSFWVSFFFFFSFLFVLLVHVAVLVCFLVFLFWLPFLFLVFLFLMLLYLIEWCAYIFGLISYLCQNLQHHD